MPPLRERLEDIPTIAEHFLRQFSKPGARVVSGISNNARRTLLAYSWPGNVRELRSVIEYAAIVGRSSWIEREDLPETLSSQEPTPDLPRSYHVRVREAKKRIIEETLARDRRAP